MSKPKSPLTIEISKSAIEHNINFVRQLIGEDVKYGSVVKGNAYGHGIETYCKVAFEAGIKQFCTYTAQEAYRVWEVTCGKADILIMGFIDSEDLEWVIENQLEFYVFEHGRVQEAIQVAKRINKKALVHIEIETGMNRTGFPIKKLESLLSLINASQSHIEARGLCTHFAGAESILNYERIKKQQLRFNKVVKLLKKEKHLPEFIHSACSAALIAFPKSKYNMVRIGVLQYGFFPSTEILANYLNQKKKFKIQPKRVLSCKSTVMDLKVVKSGEFIGYGTSYFASIPTKIAIVPVGYALGFGRNLSNFGEVLINGQRLHIIGTINMNALTVDITNTEDIKIGDEVVLIGKQGNMEISVSSFSDQGNFLNYELLTRLPSEIPRVVVD
ncbi:MAG: alanine racemase [Vicingaceae bacterium]|jgi:alanine racemase